MESGVHVDMAGELRCEYVRLIHEASLRFGGGNLTAAPLVTYNLAFVDRDGFTETGADALDLTSGDAEFMTGDVGAGLAFGYQLAVGGALVRTDLRVAYEHGFGDDRPVSHAELPGAPAGLALHGIRAGGDGRAAGRRRRTRRQLHRGALGEP